MPSDAQRRAKSAHDARLRASGWRRVSLWLSPETVAVFKPFVDKHGSMTQAVEHAIWLAAWQDMKSD